VTFPRLVQRLPTLKLAQEPIEWHATIIMRGPRVMPVELH
jgi:cytochrome P450